MRRPDKELEDIRQKSSAANEEFKRVLAKAKNATGVFRIPSVLEVANGTRICTGDPNLINFMRVEGGDALKVAEETKPDIILIDGDDSAAVDSLPTLEKLSVPKVLAISRGNYKMIQQAEAFVREVLFKPIDITDVLRITAGLG